VIQRALRSEGFTLAEVAVATAILATAVVSLAELCGIAIVSNRRARDTTYASVLASQKLEQLRALAFAFDESGQAITDPGLAASPGGTLERNTSGFVDYLDTRGAPLGGGESPPPGSMYIRRWAITPVAGNPGDLLILEVRVTPWRGDATASGSSRRPDEARITAVRTRRAT
jgi:hypothetical protein